MDLFFYLGTAANLISKRPSNRADIAYLYYLPFTMIFVSSDRLHEKIAPLFMEMNQVFIRGQELKSALGQLDEYYSSIPDEIKSQGIIKFAPHPPKNCETLVSDLWDKFMPEWRLSTRRQISPDNGLTAESLERAFREATPIGATDQRPDELDYMYHETPVPRKKGKWNIFPEDLD